MNGAIKPDINCRTSYEWHDIPFTATPTHEVNHGHAFNINIIDAPTLSNVASSSTTRTRKRQFADIEDASLMQQPHEDDFEVTEEEGNALIAPARDDYDSSSLHSGDIGLLIFRLSAPDAHSFAPSTTYMAILEEAIRACRARRRDIRCFHYVPVTPTGVHMEAEEVIILQSVNDIAAGSDEKLVLLDLEIHFHPLRGGLLVPAAASRKVIKVNPTLHRDQLLLLTGLLEYCRLQNDRCVIFKNNILWAANDDRTHTMVHGMYLKIQVPPPQDPSVDTEIAIAIARDLADEEEPERMDVAAQCRQRSNALSLRQLGTGTGAERVEWEPMIERPVHPPIHDWTFPQVVPPQRGRFADGHLWRLINLRDRTDLIECEEEGRIMYVTVWFIHHLQRVRCDEGRAARLQEDDTEWLEAIIEPWTELLDPQQDFVIHIVQPTPSCNRFECVQAHLIIEQHERPGYTTCLISILDERRSADNWIHRAYSTTVLQNTAGIIRMSELTTACQTTSCRVTLRDFPLNIVDFEELEPALNIVVRTGGTNWNAREYDTVDLMQRTKGQPVQQALDLTGGGNECADYATMTMNPLAPVFHPDRANIWSQPADIHALHAIWQIGATTWQGESPAATFLVWFLCPGGGHPRCLYARRTTLYDDVTDWRDRLTFTWRDLIIQGIPVEIHVVRPPPEDIEDGITAHIILTQLFPDQTTGILLTVQDNAVNDGLPFRIAVTLHNPGQLQQILQVSAYGNEQAAFNLRSGAQLLGPHQQFPTRHGQSFHLLVFRQNLPHGWLPPLVPAVPGAAGLGLLQTRAHIARTASERLTHGTVAQAHGPEDRIQIELDMLLPQRQCAVKLIPGHSNMQLPSFVEIDAPVTTIKVEVELVSWGHNCKVLQCGNSDKFLCLQFQEDGHHYILCNEDINDTQGCILHSQDKPLDTVGLMKTSRGTGL